MSRLLAPLLIGALGAGILVWLGTWQIQRLAWKEGVLETINAQISGPAIALPEDPNPQVHRYAPVEIEGFVEDEELFVLTSRKHIGAGYLVISPLTLTNGRRVLLDRGFISTSDKSASRPSGLATLRGNLNWPDDRRSSTPENDVEGNIWFARDVVDMAEELATEPLMVILSEATPSLGTTPLPVDTGAIPNDHLQYAITWFSLALIWLGMTGLWAARRIKS